MDRKAELSEIDERRFMQGLEDVKVHFALKFN